MLGDKNVMAMVAVNDLAKGRDFYENTLGLKPAGIMEGAGVAYKCGDGTLFMYESSTAGHNQATSATWEVTDIEAQVEELKGKGIKFDHYDLPYAKLEGDIHVMMEGAAKAVWFKDPDGNTLSLAQNAPLK